MSILSDGLPEKLMTPVVALATGLLVGGAFMIYQEINHWVTYYTTEPRAPAICYPAGRNGIEPGTQRIPAIGARDRSGMSVDDHLSTYDLDRMAMAQRACTPESCGSNAKRAYRSAIFWYVAARTSHMSKLYRSYGDAGLARARKIYRTPEDKLIEQGMRARYNTGVIRLNDFDQEQEAISILLYKGGDALRPCMPDEEAWPDKTK